MDSTSRINLLHLVLNLDIGGLERIVADSALNIDKSIFNVQVLCLDHLGHFAPILRNEGIKVSLLKRKRDRYDYLFPLRLKNFLRQNQVHIINMHSGTYFLGTQGAVLAGTPVKIYVEHGRHSVEPKWLPLMDRISSQFVDKIIAVSYELALYLQEEIKISATKIDTIINGIDCQKFSPAKSKPSIASEFGFHENEYVIGTVGRLAEVKDHLSLIESFKIVHLQRPYSRLLIVGDGPLKGKLTRAAKNLGISDAVVFAGSRDDIHDLLKVLDLFVLSSLSEGTSVSLLEAMSSGVPCIVTNVGGNPNIIKDRVNGLLVNPGYPNCLAEAIFKVLDNEEIAKEYSMRSRETVTSYYSMKSMMKNYSDLYLRLLEARGISPPRVLQPME